MKKILAILLALTTVLSLCSCSLLGKDDGETTTAQNQADSNENDGGDSQTPSAEEYGDAKVQKIGTTGNYSYVYTDNETGMEGIISLDGKFDTGAIYYGVTVASEGNYFARTKEYDRPDNLDCVNSLNLIDPYGKTLIENCIQYEKISDRFVVAAKAVKIVEDGNYDYFVTGKWVAFSADEDEAKYDAEFYVFDLKTNKIIDGVKSDTDYIHAYGDFVEYTDMSGVEHTINANGHAVPENISLYYDTKEAFYSTTDSSGKASLYDSDNNVLFSYDEEGDYRIASYSNGYFHVSKTVGEETKHFLVDKTGKAVTAEFSSPSTVGANLEVYGNVVLFNVNETGCKFQVCDFNGKVLAETENVLSCFDADHFDEAQYYTFYSTKGDMIIVSTEGEVLFEVYGDEAYESDSNNCAYKTVGEDTYYFCLKDKDFTIKADKYASEAPYLVEVEKDNDTTDIVDVTTGEVLVSGYTGYRYQTVGTDTYVYAENFDAENVDIYLIRI